MLQDIALEDQVFVADNKDPCFCLPLPARKTTGYHTQQAFVARLNSFVVICNCICSEVFLLLHIDAAEYSIRGSGVCRQTKTVFAFHRFAFHRQLRRQQPETTHSKRFWHICTLLL